MSNELKPFNITLPLVEKLIVDQFPEYAHLDIQSVKIQGHDNRTFRLGPDMLVRMPTAESYALKVPKEQQLLPHLKSYLTVPIPVPLKMGYSSDYYPFPFSIYKWLDGESANSMSIEDSTLECIALDLANFLRELQSVDTSYGPAPGQHNFYRGDHVSVYDKGAQTQIEQLSGLIDSKKAMMLWEQAMLTKWQKPLVWIHGDFASGNILIQDNKLSGVIDFGGIGIGDPACDLVITWTFLKGKSREIFRQNVNIDKNTWLRARAWCLWKATYELCNVGDKDSPYALKQKQIIEEVLSE